MTSGAGVLAEFVLLSTRRVVLGEPVRSALPLDQRTKATTPSKLDAPWSIPSIFVRAPDHVERPSALTTSIAAPSSAPSANATSLSRASLDSLPRRRSWSIAIALREFPASALNMASIFCAREVFAEASGHEPPTTKATITAPAGANHRLLRTAHVWIKNLPDLRVVASS
jgi:hypothetical protein